MGFRVACGSIEFSNWLFEKGVFTSDYFEISTALAKLPKLKCVLDESGKDITYDILEYRAWYEYHYTRLSEHSDKEEEGEERSDVDLENLSEPGDFYEDDGASALSSTEEGLMESDGGDSGQDDGILDIAADEANEEYDLSRDEFEESSIDDDEEESGTDEGGGWFQEFVDSYERYDEGEEFWLSDLFSGLSDSSEDDYFPLAW